MPNPAQARANSSGEEAPSRKLKADRACNSMYISRIRLAQTIFPAGRRRKNDRGREREWNLSQKWFYGLNSGPQGLKPVGFQCITPRLNTCPPGMNFLY